MAGSAMPRPVIIFHNISHARALAQASAETGVPAQAITAPDAMRYLGGPVLKIMIEEGRIPDVIVDCGDTSESVQLALRAGLKRLLFDEKAGSWDALTSLAAAYGATLAARGEFWALHPDRLDLLRQTDPLALCKGFLNQFRA